MIHSRIFNAKCAETAKLYFSLSLLGGRGVMALLALKKCGREY